MLMDRGCRKSMNRIAVSRLATVLFATALLLPATMAGADEGASEWTKKFQIHGFLTQAWADASYTEGGPEPFEIELGIPEDGTTDYRFLALQFRYQIGAKDLMVVQLSSRRLGESPTTQVEDEIELDWAFYERRLADHTSIKVGRIQIPLGIFNEIRDVGTILPFYRPPFTFYNEGSFTSETVDGLAISHTFWPQSDWSLETDVYGGQWELIEAGVFDPTAPPAIATAEDAFGAQLWLNTPIGIKLGWGFQQRDVTGGQEGVFRPVGEATRFGDQYVSLDASFNRFVARAEWRNLGGTLDSPLFGFALRSFQTVYYIQLGYHFTDKFSLWVQSERSEVDQTADLFTEEQNFDLRTDDGIAVNYAFSPNVVLKAEYHENEAELGAFQPVFIPPASFGLQPIVQSFPDGNYSIVSLAVSF